MIIINNIIGFVLLILFIKITSNIKHLKNMLNYNKRLIDINNLIFAIYYWVVIFICTSPVSSLMSYITFYIVNIYAAFHILSVFVSITNLISSIK